LFHFDVHEDIRTIADTTIEKDDVPCVYQTSTYFSFPTSRWEIYDPTKKWERYTIHRD
ncbi:hypothetical protein SELMODRAFT_120045, partial [Selaginella moellendorffii]